jgi:hypothetical protein
MVQTEVADDHIADIGTLMLFVCFYHSFLLTRVSAMNIFYIIGVIVVVLVILGFLGFR